MNISRRNEGKRSIRYLVKIALEYGHLESYGDLLLRVGSFRQYKPYNALLVLLQRPHATYVLPAHQWETKHGRVIRPNEQPLVMLQRGGPVMFLFDVSQTDPGPNGRPLPLDLRSQYAMADVADAESALRCIIENAKVDGVRVLDAPLGNGYAGCVTLSKSDVRQSVRLGRQTPSIGVRVQFDILLNRSYSATERLATIAHELGHLYCGHLGPCKSELWPDDVLWRDRSGLSHERDELEAESVARVVFHRLFPGVVLPDHLHQYFAVEPDLNGLDLEYVLTAAGRVIEMAGGPAPRRPKAASRVVGPPRGAAIHALDSAEQGELFRGG